jgi:hypothetical protein
MEKNKDIITLQENYEDAIKKGYEILNTNNSFSSAFCRFVEVLQTLPPQKMEEAKTLFQDINNEIQRYNDQYKILLDELGILCPDDPEGDAAKRFFLALMDLYRLAFGIFKQYDELSIFNTSLQSLITLLETGTLELPQEQNISNAVLIQLTKSAHYLSKNKLSLDEQARVIRKEGGKRKNTTRKRRRAH